MEEPITDEVLKQHWYDATFGYTTAPKFHKRLLEEGYNVSLKRVREWIAKQNAYQIASYPKKPKHYNSVTAPYPGANYQIDIMIQKKFKTHRGNKHIFVCIDVASRKLGLVAMKNRKKESWIDAWNRVLGTYFKKELGGAGIWPASVSCDREFINVDFRNALQERGVNLFYSQVHQPNKNPIVERVIRTIRGWLFRWREANDDPDWDMVLPDLCYNYNHTYHNTLKATPQGIWEGREKSKQVVRWVPAQRKLQEKVRVIQRQVGADPFKKSDSRRVSRKVYSIVQRAPKDKGHRQFKWVLADTETGNIVRERTRSRTQGEPVQWLDYELIPVPHTHGLGAERPNLQRQHHFSVLGDRLQREGLGPVVEEPMQLPRPGPGRPVIQPVLGPVPAVRANRGVPRARLIENM